MHIIIDNIVRTWIGNGAMNGGIYGDSLKHSLQRTWADETEARRSTRERLSQLRGERLEADNSGAFP